MEIIYLLIPLSIVLTLMIMLAVAWAVYSGQFEDMNDEGARILEETEL
jgi:cbb3-type cytochrome oxidase maturation protein